MGILVGYCAWIHPNMDIPISHQFLELFLGEYFLGWVLEAGWLNG
ncbi:hypothetical protein HBZC1_01430 [Helicobacter bizzozeronii CIII-1]|uniref:Uncharacterized protein n=1 Tax=Helicobacter bizzozeronii (strain CIII-1) TaxID=1002804 RepID=F8KPY9_HELBC|nr:hypothetical protein HBZC1_01430 [Helicobacter bizzozeronii CIII-1]